MTVYPDPLVIAAHREASLLHLPKAFMCESLTPMSLADIAPPILILCVSVLNHNTPYVTPERLFED